MAVQRDEHGRIVSGVLNPNGRPPKGEALTEILREKLDKDAVVEKLIQIAMEKEDLAALKYIIDRIDGKPKETIEAQINELPRLIRFDDKDDTEDTEAD